MNNTKKLKRIVEDTLLLDEGEYSESLKRDDVDSWDSLGMVSLLVGLQKEFGVSMDAAETVSVESIDDLKSLLVGKGVDFSK